MVTKKTGNLVVAKDYEHVNQTLNRFKKKIEASNLINDIKQHEFFEKPTTKRKRKRGAANSRWQKYIKDQQLPKKYY